MLVGAHRGDHASLQICDHIAAAVGPILSTALHGKKAVRTNAFDARKTEEEHRPGSATRL